MNPGDQVRRAAEAFRLPGGIVGIDAHGDGLIHDTFAVSVNAPGGRERFILQRINQQVFADPKSLMENIERVITHLQARAMRPGRDPHREVVGLLPAKAGGMWCNIDDQAWRMTRFVEGTEIVARAPSPGQAHQIGRAFGHFLDDLSDFPPLSLRAALPGYRDTELYLDSLWRIVDTDPLHRAKDAREEIAFLEARVDEAMGIQHLQRSGRLPLRVIHGDTKLNNVLLDASTGAGVCVIDLDTVMPGLLLHDIGDCVREAWVGAPPTGGLPRGMLQRVEPITPHEQRIFEAIVTGFLSALSTPPSPLELSSITTGVQSITLELGARFLTDYMAGDRYFKTSQRQENLARARTHLHLSRRIERSEQELQSIVLRCSEGLCNPIP